jgi:dTDP-glucose 4,6-dehydratase
VLAKAQNHGLSCRRITAYTIFIASLITDTMRIIVTGAAGFIGNAVCRRLATTAGIAVHGLDSLTYAANPLTVAELTALPNFTLHQLDITDTAALTAAFATIQPAAVLHLAAETHVDRSIDYTTPFINTNILGTHQLLQAALRYWRGLPDFQQDDFRFLHVSTDEVYGALGATGRFGLNAPHAPNSPYAASKAAAEDLVRAWHATFALPTLIANYCNIYGPYQFPEKLIPTMILKALHGEIMPIYGLGDHIREWLYVDDAVTGLLAVLTHGRVGQKYHLGAMNELTNLKLVQQLCLALDAAEPNSAHCPHSAFIQFVTDRPGHDFRYALDCSATQQELGWQATTALKAGLEQTVAWYLANPAWWQKARIVYNGVRLGLG